MRSMSTELYHERVKKFIAYIQESNFMQGSMTDPSDRSKGPSQQADPDFYPLVKKTDPGWIRGPRPTRPGR
jgi:aromatic ring hydroxylase